MARRFIAKIFKNGGSQAIRLPKECQMPGEEVAIVREGNRLIVEPINRRGWNRDFLTMISTPAAEDLFSAKEQPRPQERDLKDP
jgi:antitoxin VapB